MRIKCKLSYEIYLMERSAEIHEAIKTAVFI